MRWFWLILFAFLVLVAGTMLGFGFMLFVPLVGTIVLLGLGIWMMARHARGKPPMK